MKKLLYILLFTIFLGNSPSRESRLFFLWWKIPQSYYSYKMNLWFSEVWIEGILCEMRYIHNLCPFPGIDDTPTFFLDLEKGYLD